jgi:hypothetical protein
MVHVMTLFPGDHMRSIYPRMHAGQIEPHAEQVPLGEEADAKLLIGDAALQSAFEDPTPHHDLGRMWLERTGAMVFARAAPEPRSGVSALEEAGGVCAPRAGRVGAARARGE